MCNTQEQERMGILLPPKRFDIIPNKPNGFLHAFQLGEFILIFRGIRSNFSFFTFFDEIHVSKLNSPRWDAAFCDVTSGGILFAYVP